MNQADPIQIPYSQLPQDVLDGIIKDFILREGTDYGHEEYSYEEKAAQVLALLKVGKAQIYFDPDTETCTIIPTT